MRKTLAFAMLCALALPVSAFADAPPTYKAKCAACHGADGSGQNPMGKKLNLKGLGSADVQKLTDAEMTKIIVEGKGKMKPAKLPPADVTALVAFIRSLKK